jgi:hypothetical protein
MNKGFTLSWMLAAGLLACTASLAQQRLPWGGIAVASECGRMAATSSLREIRYRATLQGADSAKTPQQLAEFAQVLSKDPRFVGSLRCFQALSAPPAGR